MADASIQLIAELLGEAFIDGVSKGQHRAAERLRALWRWLREVGVPPDGAEFVTRDGTVHSGVLVIERNRATLFFGVRHPGYVPGPASRSSFGGRSPYASGLDPFLDDPRLYDR